MKSEKAESENEKNPQAELIAEMMLAKAVLEEKSELLARQERTIRELKDTVLRLQEDVKTLQAERAEWREGGKREGSLEAVAEAARLAVEHLGREDEQWGLASRLLRHFAERYGLEVIDRPDTVDPDLHQVVEVVESPDEESSVQVLARGFRLGGRTIQPALVRVVRGKTPKPEG